MKKQKVFQKFASLKTWIVGTQYYDGADEVGDSEVFFEQEPDNPFDRNAIAAFTPGGTQIGHLPRHDVLYLTPLINRGLIALRGSIQESRETGRISLTLEVFSTQKISEVLETDESDDWRAIYHNLFVRLWASLDRYNPENLKEFRDHFRPVAHGQELFPKTQFLYRMLKERIRELRDRELEEIRESLIRIIRELRFGRMLGWPELSILPLYPADYDQGREEAPPKSLPAAADTIMGLPSKTDSKMISLLPGKIPYPPGARGLLILAGGNWYSLDLFGSCEAAQVYWFSTITEAIGENILIPPYDEENSYVAVSTESIKKNIINALNRARIFFDKRESDGEKTFEIMVEQREGSVTMEDKGISEVHLKENFRTE